MDRELLAVLAVVVVAFAAVAMSFSVARRALASRDALALSELDRARKLGDEVLEKERARLARLESALSDSRGAATDAAARLQAHRFVIGRILESDGPESLATAVRKLRPVHWSALEPVVAAQLERFALRHVAGVLIEISPPGNVGRRDIEVEQIDEFYRFMATAVAYERIDAVRSDLEASRSDGFREIYLAAVRDLRDRRGNAVQRMRPDEDGDVAATNAMEKLHRFVHGDPEAPPLAQTSRAEPERPLYFEDVFEKLRGLRATILGDGVPAIPGGAVNGTGDGAPLPDLQPLPSAGGKLSLGELVELDRQLGPAGAGEPVEVAGRPAHVYFDRCRVVPVDKASDEATNANAPDEAPEIRGDSRPSKPSREEVLCAFAVENDTGKATLERYLRDFPEHAGELVDLSRELARQTPPGDQPLSVEDKALIARTWAKYVASTTAAEPAESGPVPDADRLDDAPD